MKRWLAKELLPPMRYRGKDMATLPKNIIETQSSQLLQFEELKMPTQASKLLTKRSTHSQMDYYRHGSRLEASQRK
jgi:hypothetical protein